MLNCLSRHECSALKPAVLCHLHLHLKPDRPQAMSSFGTYAAAQYTASRIPGAKFVGFDHGGQLRVGHDAEVRADVVKLLSNSR